MSGERGELVIVASPSGGGKTTLIKRVIAGLADEGRRAHFSVSHTTRRPRTGERHGVDYHFVEREEFEAMISRGEFLEHAEVHGNLYGTSRAEVEERLAAGCDVFLDIDVQGARQVREAVPYAVAIFVLPPSREELLRRLVERRQDGSSTIALRMRNAVSEMREIDQFDYAIINDRLEEATRALACIVAATRHRASRMRAVAAAIVADFEDGRKED